MNTFVIARYKEDIAWIDELPPDAVVHVYNKGPELDLSTIRRPVHLHTLRNAGRESGTYLHHLMHEFRAREPGFTVFTQADPFEHSPYFLDLVKASHQWRDIQPLSVMWRADKKLPPMSVIEEERSDWIGALPVRAERFSLRTWAPISFFDEGAWGIGTSYRAKHMLGNGANVAAHFLELLGLDDAAERAFEAEVGVFSYGAIFAVRNEHVARFVDAAGPRLPMIELLTRADLNYGYIFERMWLHFFGEPFVRFEPLRRTDTPAAGVQPTAVVAAPAVIPARTGGADLRALAYAELGNGRIDEGRALLQKALFTNPVDHEVLSDLAALAYRQGNHASAIPYARRALAQRPDHAESRFTLGMCLAASGEPDEALAELRELTTGAVGDAFRRSEPALAALALAEAERLVDAGAAAPSNGGPGPAAGGPGVSGSPGRLGLPGSPGSVSSPTSADRPTASSFAAG